MSDFNAPDGESFPYIYDARFISINDYEKGVVDGDTFWMQLDLGFYFWMVDSVRLAEVDTREIHFVDKDSEEYERGVLHREFVKGWVETGRSEYDGRFPFQVGSVEYDHTGKYGRSIAYVVRKSDGDVLNDRLLEEFDDVEAY